VIFGAGKSAGQISDIVGSMMEQGTSLLVTRLNQATFDQLKNLPPDTEYHAMSQLLWWHESPPPTRDNTVAVVSAGTSDMHVAEEAALTAEFYGNPVARIYDVGVAGLHRLLARLEDLRSARVLIVVAGMEGALPSVVGGLVDKPVIAVPTSVGYGAAFDGVAALLGMMTSCASGVSVVNIDNGFGAGFLANRINRL
jgi:NCAIR mutase (PurE)-related protein